MKKETVKISLDKFKRYEKAEADLRKIANNKEHYILFSNVWGVPQWEVATGNTEVFRFLDNLKKDTEKGIDEKIQNERNIIKMNSFYDSQNKDIVIYFAIAVLATYSLIITCIHFL
ncbi:MAG: hypothetical protein ACLFQA_00260 [Bacteroidales bacterium]